MGRFGSEPAVFSAIRGKASFLYSAAQHSPTDLGQYVPQHGTRDAMFPLPSIRRIASLTLALGIPAILAGCNLEPPAIFNPGDLQYQRARANRYDPFPDPQAGPAIPEVRPREFSNPPPEASRARWQKAPPP
jgi:hypothetical protein